MKFRHAFTFIACLIVGLWSAVTSARAVTHITSADTLTVSLSGLPAATYMVASIQLNFWDFGSNVGPDVLGAGDSFRVNLLTSGNALVSEQTYGLGGGSVIAVGLNLLGPVNNTGHFFIDQITGSFDLYSIFISGSTDGNTFTEAFTATFEVGTATPLPAALPLFAGGIGLIGLLARRRKQKASVRLH